MQMIEGVEILRTINYWHIIILFLGLGILLFGVASAVSVIMHKKNKMNPNLNVLLTTLQIVGVFFAFYSVFECICYETKYQVKIDDTVNAIEFVEHYDVKYKYSAGVYLVIEKEPLEGKFELENTDMKIVRSITDDIQGSNSRKDNLEPQTFSTYDNWMEGGIE